MRAWYCLSACVFFKFACSEEYTACSLYKVSQIHSICSDYRKSTNDTHYTVPLNLITEKRDPITQRAYTVVDNDAQEKLESAVLSAVKKISFFPYLERPCQNSLIGGICAAYFPSCKGQSCPTEQPLVEQFKYCSAKERSFEKDKPHTRIDPPQNVYSNISLCAKGNCGLITQHCPHLRLKSSAPNASYIDKSLIDIFNLKEIRISDIIKPIGHRDVDRQILPDCFKFVDCYNPESAYDSLDIALHSFETRFNTSESHKSNICDEYASTINVRYGHSWDTTVQKIYKYTASFIAETGIPNWLPSKCSSSLKQLICSSVFGETQYINLSYSFNTNPGICESVCLSVEENCESLFKLAPSLFEATTNNFSLYPLPNDIHPRLHSGGLKLRLQPDFDVYEGSVYDRCQSILTGILPNTFGYPFASNYETEANLLNNFISTLRQYTDLMGATRATCTNAFMKTNCTTCAPTCPTQMVIYDHNENGDTKPTYSVLSSACAVPCPFNTRTKSEYVESMMLRFVGGTAGVVGSMFLLWIWLSQPGRDGEKTLSSLFCIALVISITLVTGPAFEPFRYFCHDDAHVTTQKTDDGTYCVLEASIVLFALNMSALLWLCLVVERLTIEVLQQPGALSATPTTLKQRTVSLIHYCCDRFVNFPRPETGDHRRFPVYMCFSSFISILLVYMSWSEGLLGYDGVSSWCTYAHPSHTQESRFTPTNLHYTPMATVFTLGLLLLVYRVYFHVKQEGIEYGIKTGVCNRLSFFLICFGLFWNFMIYKRLVTYIYGRLEQEASTAIWHKCLLVAEVSRAGFKWRTNLGMQNASAAGNQCHTLPSERIDHNIALGIDALVSGGGWLLLMMWGTSMVHIRFIMEEFGFTRSGLSWYEDRDREQQNIMDETRSRGVLSM
jgi:hypothetical protein